MARLIVIRLASLLPLMLMASLVAFFLLQLSPTDPAVVRLGETATDEAYAAFRTTIGLDRPIVVQYLSWLGGVVSGDFGSSWHGTAPVSEMLASRLPVTMSIAFGALVVGIVVGVPAGVVAGVRAGRPVDSALTGAASIGQAVPNFWAALLLVAFVALPFGLFPAVGYVRFGESPVGWLRSITLPAIALGSSGAAAIARQTRVGFVRVLHEPFVRTAVAGGISRRRILFRTVFRNASIPLVTTLAAQASALLGGSVVVEQVFALPGMGQLVLNAIRNADLPIVMGFVVVTAALMAIIQLSLDLAYAALDPRVRLS